MEKEKKISLSLDKYAPPRRRTYPPITIVMFFTLPYENVMLCKSLCLIIRDGIKTLHANEKLKGVNLELVWYRGNNPLLHLDQTK